jgi:sec-independent protein translocase protein TatC
MSDEKNISLKSHLTELRNRLIFCVIFFIIIFAICYVNAAEIYNFLLQPFIENNNSVIRKVIYTSPAEAFLTYLKLSLYFSLFISFPIFASQFYFFLEPGLYKNEKKNISLILFFSYTLFLLGMMLVLYVVLPLAVKFFIGFENKISGEILSINFEARISEYFNFVLNLILAFGFAFQLPILLLFLIKIGLLRLIDLEKRRKYFVIMIFVIAAILTPPDVISQITLAIPMIFLFEIAIFSAKKILIKK